MCPLRIMRSLYTHIIGTLKGLISCRDVKSITDTLLIPYRNTAAIPCLYVRMSKVVRGSKILSYVIMYLQISIYLKT